MRQLDLFRDSPVTVARNELIEALSARDSSGSRAALERLTTLNPVHGLDNDARTLIALMETPAPERPDEAFEWIRSLETEWNSAAEALLGADRAPDFLAPVWTRVGEALESAPFDLATPKHHASWAYRQGCDWFNVKRSVLSVDGYRAVPFLLARLAEAERRTDNRARAIDHWFTLCWHGPEHFKQIVEEPDFPDEAIASAWRRARDADVQPELSPPWFPAWLLLEEPILARQCATRERQDPPRHAYEVVRALLATQEGDERKLALRQELKTLNSGLLAAFLRKFA